jgi:hypothetical protein
MVAHRKTRWLDRIALTVFIIVSGATAIFAQTPDAGPTPIAEAAPRDPAPNLVQVETRRSDSLWNGAVIGAAVGVTSGLLLCRTMEPWSNCRDDVGPMLRTGALGAAIGIGIDALMRKREVVSQPAPSREVYVAPVIGRGAGGVRLAVRF